VYVIRDKYPRIYRGLPAGKDILKAPNQILIVFLAPEQLAALYAPYHYMMEGTFDIESGFSWHDTS
jgi:hypothetical protein